MNQPDWNKILEDALDLCNVPKEIGIKDTWTPGMSAEEKLAFIKAELERMAFPDEETEEEEFWMAIQCECDNSADAAYGNDAWNKSILRLLADE